VASEADLSRGAGLLQCPQTHRDRPPGQRLLVTGIRPNRPASGSSSLADEALNLLHGRPMQAGCWGGASTMSQASR